LPRVLPRRLEVFKGSERLALGIGEILRIPTPPPERTDVEIGSKVAFANELPIECLLKLCTYFSSCFIYKVE
jgi:hypothetical protein